MIIECRIVLYTLPTLLVLQPPPPGVMPNAAQLASSQGHTVVAGQRQETMMGGTGDGGYVVW